MKEQTKTTRVKVLRPFYLSRDKLAQPGDELELDTHLAGSMVSGGKAVLLSAMHKSVVVAPPAESTFRKPDAEKRRTWKGKKS